MGQPAQSNEQHSDKPASHCSHSAGCLSDLISQSHCGVGWEYVWPCRAQQTLLVPRLNSRQRQHTLPTKGMGLSQQALPPATQPVLNIVPALFEERMVARSISSAAFCWRHSSTTPPQPAKLLLCAWPCADVPCAAHRHTSPTMSHMQTRPQIDTQALSLTHTARKNSARVWNCQRKCYRAGVPAAPGVKATCDKPDQQGGAGVLYWSRHVLT